MRNWKVALLALSIGVWSTSAQAALIEFDDAAFQTGTVSHVSGGPMVGADIDIDTIIATDVPLPNALLCVQCVLSFTTGAVISEGGPVWNFGAGGSFVINGSAYDGLTLVASGDLLTGVFGASPTGPTVIGGGSVISMIGFGPDTKHPDLLAYLGLPSGTNFDFATTTISFTNVKFGANGAFSGDVSDVDVVNHVPDGGTTMALLGLGLVGLGTLRRKFLI